MSATTAPATVSPRDEKAPSHRHAKGLRDQSANHETVNPSPDYHSRRPGLYHQFSHVDGEEIVVECGARFPLHQSARGPAAQADRVPCPACQASIALAKAALRRSLRKVAP